MFGKKPPPPWSVQILTHDFSVEGFADPDELDLISFSLAKASDWSMSGVTLAQPQLTPTGLQQLGETSGSQFATTLDKVLAFIPRDAAGAANIIKEFSKIDHELPATCFVGPYTISGTLRLNTEQITLDNFYLVRDAQISCRTLGAKWPGLNVPQVLIHPLGLQGYLTP